MAVRLIGPLPKAPNKNDPPAVFNADSNVWVAHQPQFRTQINQVAEDTDNNAATAVSAAVGAQTFRNEAQAARNEAVLMVNTPVWDPARSYATGTTVKVMSDGQLYERLAPGGVNSTDPSVDAVNGVGTHWRKAPLMATVLPPIVVLGAKTFALTDVYRDQFHPASDTAARTWTIPSNAAVKFPNGTAISIVNQSGAGVITIAINNDTLALLGTASTGSRQIASGGGATLQKMADTYWIISGVGVT